MHTWILSNRYAKHCKGRGVLNPDYTYKLAKIGFNFSIPRSVVKPPVQTPKTPPSLKRSFSDVSSSPYQDSPTGKTDDDEDFDADVIEEKVESLEYANAVVSEVVF